jgi:hypothetical protein
VIEKMRKKKEEEEAEGQGEDEEGEGKGVSLEGLKEDSGGESDEQSD